MIDPAAPVTLVVQVYVTSMNTELTRGSAVVDRQTLRTTVVAAHFQVQAVARRGDGFVRVTGVPVSN